MKILLTAICLAVLLFFSGAGICAQTQDSTMTEINVISFPIDRTTELSFVPDPRFPNVTGRAKIDLNERGMASVKADFNNLPSVLDIGSLYASYVFWAISSDGTSQRLGEIKVNPKSKLSNPSFEAEIQLNTFGMLVTVEPHYLVRLPGRSVVLKSAAATGKNGESTKSSVARCMLSEDYFRDRPKLDKKQEKEYRLTPISFIAAQNAVALARYAGAETYSPDLYNESVSLLEQVEKLIEKNAKEKEIDLLANQTVGAAANAEKNAVEVKKERKTQTTEIRNSRELADIKDSLVSSEAQKDLLKEDLERVRREKDNLQRDFNEKFSQSVRLEQENRELRVKFDQSQEELNRLKVQNQRFQNIIDYRNEFPVLLQFLGIFGKVEKRDNDLVLVFPNSIWSKEEKNQIDPPQMEKLLPLFKKIGETPYLQMTIFSFVNSSADLAEGQELAESRAKIVGGLFVSNGVDKRRVVTKAFLQNQPVKQSKKTQPADANRIEITFMLVDQ